MIFNSNFSQGLLAEKRINLQSEDLQALWQTEITAWDPLHRFVVEQRRDPYRKWIHEHTFTPCGANSKIRDFVQYDLFGGRLVNFLLVRCDGRRIFILPQTRSPAPISVTVTEIDAE